MNLGDPELELIDPTPDVHSLFVHFDKIFFWGKLVSKTTVRWSKRMYSCAGICGYECRAGFCDIALSEPLLKLRPRKDLIETLLHEMIHALLFVTDKDQDRDGHGPNFKAHMHRINKSAGLNISIYHTFHDEVELYQTHWWRCNGACQMRRPHFGIVRRSTNRAPGPRDYWWKDHLRSCGGKFIKIKEPPEQQKSTGKKNTTTKPNADITKYISNNGSVKTVLKDSGNITTTTKTNSKSVGVYTIGKKGVIIAPKPPPKPIAVFTGTGYTLNSGSKHFSVDSTGANKEITTKNKKVDSSIKKPIKTQQVGILKDPVKVDVRVDSSLKNPIKTQEVGILKDPVNRIRPSSSLKHKTKATDSQSPPTKSRKIDDYFNSTTILKDLYGDDYKLKQSNTGKKLVAVKIEMVDCPICSCKFNKEEINRHLDECLNKDIIEKLTKDGVNSVQETQPSRSETVINTAPAPKLREIVGKIQPIPVFKPKAIPDGNNNEINRKISVTSEKTNVTNVINGLTPEDLELITPVLAFNPFPPFPENIDDDDIIDLTSYDLDTPNINTVNADKGRRKTESEATLSSGSLIRKVPVSPLPISYRGNSTTLNKHNMVTTREKDEVVVKAGPSKVENVDRHCPICREIFDKSVEEHLDECLGFSKKYTGTHGASAGSNNLTVVIDDGDDILDESQTLNATGTKTPCPCCMKMVEQDDMNDHLDVCLGIS